MSIKERKIVAIGYDMAAEVSDGCGTAWSSLVVLTDDGRVWSFAGWDNCDGGVHLKALPVHFPDEPEEVEE